MKVKLFWRTRLARHLVGWLLVLGLCLAAIGMLPPLKARQVLEQLPLNLAVLALPIYVHFWLLTHWLERGYTRRYLLATAVTVLLGAMLNLAEYPVADTRPAPDLADYANSVISVALALLITTGLRYVRRGIASHLQVRELQARQVETELSLLKAQVNQHFLFNTLNNLYGLSLTAPEQMPEALLQLADLMRYQLDSSRQSTTTVGTEAEYLTNYIGLEKLRLRQNTQVEFTANLPYPDRPLAPLLLLPLVENCFKHAIGPGSANFIRIHLTQNDVGLTLRTHNSVPPHFRPAPSGLGLPNLRARLAQFYPGSRHQLSVEATSEHYQATLQLLL